MENKAEAIGIKWKNCPLCKNKKTSLKYKNMGDKGYFINGKFDLIECQNCKFEFLSYLLNEKQLAKYYPSEDYYSFYNYNPLALKYHKLSAYYHSKKTFLFNFVFFPLSPILYKYYIKQDANVIEIGCGNGMKLEIYRKYGMKTAGIEPYGPGLAEKEKVLGIERISVKDAKYKENSFDFIVLKEVLEHVPNQKLLLERCFKWMKPGGRFIITVPNTDSFLCRLFKQDWFGYDVPRHLYNYNPENLSFFLKKFGFKIIRIKLYEMPYMLDGSLKFHIARKTGKKEHEFIFSNFAKIAATPIALMLTYLKRGSLMEIECTK